MKTKLQLTNDGSHTLFVPELDETYHSVHGAVNEAKHVFLKMGMDEHEASPLRILEIGFGTGLNAFLTALHANEQGRSVVYHSIEKYPVAEETIQQLNYAEQIDASYKDLYNQLHTVSWEEEHKVNDSFTLKKIKGDLTSFDFASKYDVIYFDAFAPNKQDEMWSEAIFQKMYDCLNPKGIIVTYCAKGSVKRTLKAVGFEQENLPGPPGKREMIRGRKS